MPDGGGRPLIRYRQHKCRVRGLQGEAPLAGTLLNEKNDKQSGGVLCLFHTVHNWKVWFSDTHPQWWLQGAAPGPQHVVQSPSLPLVAERTALCCPKRATEASHGAVRPMLCP